MRTRHGFVLPVLIAIATLVGAVSWAQSGDTTKKVEVIMYLAGDGAPDSQLVTDAINVKLQKDLNATLKINNIAWADWGTKYPLLLAAGEDYDLVYTSNWAGFADQVVKGYYMPLEKLLPTYAPNVWKQVPAEGWKEATYQGSIYALPARENDFVIQVMAVRGDLREKYKAAPVVDYATMEAYMDALKKGEPADFLPFNASSGDNPQFLETQKYELLTYTPWLVAKPESLSDVVWPTLIPAYTDFAVMMKRWADKGFMSRNLLTSDKNSRDQFLGGKSAVATGNTVQIKTMIEQVNSVHPEWKPEFVSFRYKVAAVTHKNDWMSNGMAVARNAKNPERALMIVDKIRTDRSYYDLLFYGVPGKDFELTTDGKVTYPKGVDGKTTGYIWDNEGQWGFRVFEFMRQRVGEWMDYYNVVMKKYQTFATPNPYAGFIMNTDAFATELAAYTQVYNQYVIPIQWGKVADPVAAVKDVNDRLRAAGGTKMIAELKKQLDAFFKK